MNLYHNGELYGKRSTLYHYDTSNSNVVVVNTEGNVVIPPFKSIEHIFPISNGLIPQQERWISELNGTSKSCSDGNDITHYFFYGSPKEITYYSSVTKENVLYSKAEVGLSFGIVKETVEPNLDDPAKSLVIDNDSLVNITAIDSDGNIVAGARDDRWALYINSSEVALPYTGILNKGDVITFTGNNVKYTVQRHKDEVATKSIQIPFGQFNELNNSSMILNGFGIVPFCMCREMKVWFESDGNIKHQLGALEPCELKDNPHVKITSS